MEIKPMQVRHLGVVDYQSAFQAMKDFTDTRDTNTPDELWLLQHPPVYTQGLAGKPEHLLNPSAIPVVPIDRGGQITYHGLGQIVMYVLLDIQRKNMGIRPLVSMIETSVIELLARHGVQGQARADAPGVYVEGRKIASLGLKVRRGCTYHGVALNVDMDLTPFTWINPCGLIGMEMTQLKALHVLLTPEQAGDELAVIFKNHWENHTPTNKHQAK